MGAESQQQRLALMQHSSLLAECIQGAGQDPADPDAAAALLSEVVTSLVASDASTF